MYNVGYAMFLDDALERVLLLNVCRYKSSHRAASSGSTNVAGNNVMYSNSKAKPSSTTFTSANVPSLKERDKLSSYLSSGASDQKTRREVFRHGRRAEGHVPMCPKGGIREKTCLTQRLRETDAHITTTKHRRQSQQALNVVQRSNV